MPPYRNVVRLVVKSMKDKVPNIFQSCIHLYTSLLASLSGREVHTASELALPVLIEKLGDNNTRIRESAKETILSLAGNKVNPTATSALS